ncbi:MAG: tetratricopeptide repeat protein [Nitrospira sp.]|nr:tetratricopeptide repeat protein [Nitrospira sp.]
MTNTKDSEKEPLIKAKIGDRVNIHFTCKFEDGTVYDSSIGKEPLQFIIGENQTFTGLEQAVIGMIPEESKSIEISSDNIYGPHRKEIVHIIRHDQFPEDIKPEIGLQFQIKQENGVTEIFRVTDISDTNITLDGNHPLAGKKLFFDIQLIESEQTDISKAADFYDQGIAFQDKGRLEEAITCYQKAIELNKNLTGAFYNLGVAFQKKGQIDKSILYYEIAIGLNQDFTEAHYNLGIAYKEKALFDEAMICFQRVLQLKPDHSDASYNFGNVYAAKGQFNEAIQCYQRAIELNPDYAEAHWNIALINLLLGNFKEGWKGYEWRWKLKDIISHRDFSQPIWNGYDINGKTILLHAEQGFGDTIQFIRYAPLVAQRSARVILECQKELVSLLKSVEGIHQVISYEESLPDFNIHCPLLNLPSIFNTTTDNIPAEIPYITADASLIKKWHEKVKHDTSKLKIGLVWAGEKLYKNDFSRSCSFEIFSALNLSDDITWYSLQKGDPSTQVENSLKGINLIDYTDELRDFSDTAALMQNLDLIISVDTAVAHLAGALGKPIWTLLPFVPDWRWMLNREDSPWYPTMRLFRQPSRGDWKSILENVADSLNKFIT